MKKNLMIFLVSITTYCCGMDKEVNYIIYQKLKNCVPITKIDLFEPVEPGKPGILIRTIYFDEGQTKRLVQLVEVTRNISELSKLRKAAKL